jgi:hypothetical protein
MYETVNVPAVFLSKHYQRRSKQEPFMIEESARRRDFPRFSRQPVLPRDPLFVVPAASGFPGEDPPYWNIEQRIEDAYVHRRPGL